MSGEPDPDRLKALEEKLAAARKDQARTPRGDEHFSAASQGWRMVIELVAGLGIGFGIGALFALVGVISGIMNGNNNQKMAKLGAQIQGKPTPEQATAMGAIQKQQGWVIPVNTYSLLLAVFFMAIARYLVF